MRLYNEGGSPIPMTIQRSAGILLHITSLPGAHGIGTLGPEAYEFADMLCDAGITWWQLLPIGPVNPGLGYSPYASPSAFAGNPMFISVDKLTKEPWFTRKSAPSFFGDPHFVNFENVTRYLEPVLRLAFEEFTKHAAPADRAQLEQFRGRMTWVDDYALFSALSDYFKTNDWLAWDAPIRLREKGAVAAWRTKLGQAVDYHVFLQYIFFKQWRELKAYCGGKGIRLIGDIPIYITLEGADAWANPGLVDLDSSTGKPVNVAGVPPDYFSETGQRWGNPLYNWHTRDGALNREVAAWWIMRMKHLISLVDLVRIDHFRGFESYWAVPENEKTAVKGSWKKGPGRELFDMMQKEIGDLPVIAEDLGIITPAVEELRDGLTFPGMKILQFAFDHNNKNYYLPHNIKQNCVLYTGTHDNNTTNGWFYGKELNDDTRAYVIEYIGAETIHDLHMKLIRQAYRTPADLVIIPAQDILGYGEEYRMNIPGTGHGNWKWKLTGNVFTPEIIGVLRRMGQIYDRIPETELST